jgi:hypothetical protein
VKRKNGGQHGGVAVENCVYKNEKMNIVNVDCKMGMIFGNKFFVM